MGVNVHVLLKDVVGCLERFCGSWASPLMRMMLVRTNIIEHQ